MNLCSQLSLSAFLFGITYGFLNAGPCEDHETDLAWSLMGQRDVPGNQGNNITLVNTAAPGDMPTAWAEHYWAYGSTTGIKYADSVVVASGGGTSWVCYPGRDFLPSLKVDPLLHGFSGMFRVTTILKGCGPVEEHSAVWHFEHPKTKCGGKGCSNGACSLDAKIGSVDFSVSLGSNTHGRSESSLSYKSENIANLGAAGLVFNGRAADSTVTKISNVISSVVTGNSIATVVAAPSVGDPNRFQIQFSYAVDPRPSPPDPVYRRITIEQDGSNLIISDDVEGVTKIKTFSNPVPEIWTLEDSGAKKETRTTLSDNGNYRVYQHKIEEKSDVDGSWKTVSLNEEHQTRFTWGWETTKTIVAPGTLNLVSETEYFDSSNLLIEESNYRRFGQIKSEKFPNGLVRNYEYFMDDPLDESFTRLDVITEHFAGSANAKQTHIHTKWVGSQRTTLEETYVGNALIAKKETIATSSRTIEKVYPAANASPLVTQTTFTSGALETIYPDGTMERSKEVVTNGVLVRTVSKGVKYPSGTAILRGTEEVTEFNRAGTELRRINRAIYGGVAYRLEEKQLIEKDHRERPLRIDVFHGNNVAATYSELSQYSCCGLSYERGADGVPSYHYYDVLGRLKKTHRNGLVEETVRDGLTVNTHRYPEAIISPNSEAAAANLLRADTTNLNGEMVQTQTRSPKDGALIATNYTISYNVGGGVGKRTVEVQPSTPDDGGVTPNIITDQYIDGETKSISGSLVVNRQFAYSANAVGIAMTESKVGAGGVLFESVTTQQDFAGRTVKVSYTGDKDSNGIVDYASNTYDNGGNRKSFVDPDGVTTLYAEDAATGQVTKAIDMNGNGMIDMSIDRIEMNTPGVGLVGGAVTIWSERAVRTTNEHGVSVTQLVSRSEQSSSGLSSKEITYGPGNQLVTSQVITPESGQPGNRTITVVNSDDSFKVSTFTSGMLQQEKAFDADSVSLYTIDRTYDAHQRIATMTDSREAGAISYTYVSPLVDVVVQSSQDGKSYILSYDDRGRRVSEDSSDTLDASGATVSNTRILSYWLSGVVKELNETPGYRRVYTYDASLRLETMTTFGGVQAVTRWEYDADKGWLVRKRHNSPIPGQGAGESYSYTPGGRLKTRTLARGVSSTYSYDLGGTIGSISYSDGTPAVIIQDRDQSARITALSDVAGNLTLSYNSWGKIASESYGGSGVLSGWESRSSFDYQGRLSGLSLRREGTGIDEFGAQYRYDEAGRLAEVLSAGKAARYTYDTATSAIRQVAYFSQGQLVLMANRQYDEANRLGRVTFHDGNLGATHRIYSDYRYTYDTNSRVTDIATKDGTVEKIKYNAAGEVVSSRRFLPGGGSSLRGRTFTWEYDGIGNRISVGKGGDPSGAGLRNTGYAADALNQYSEITNPGVEDVVGTAPISDSVSIDGSPANRQEKWFHGTITGTNSSGPVWKTTSVTNGVDMQGGAVLIPAAAQSLSYDEDGNLESNGIHSYRWDGENRLISIETSEVAIAAGIPYQRVQYAYDVFSRRVCREVFYAKSGLVAEYTGYIWKGWRCVGELSLIGSLSKAYVWGASGDGRFHFGDGNGALLWMQDFANSGVHFCHYDRGGNIVGLSDPSGEQTAEYRYGVFGEMLEQKGAYADSNSFRFSTKEWDRSGMVYYFGYRYYEPTSGRWLSRDPISENGGVNLYGMVRNNPVNFVDLLGLHEKGPFDGKHPTAEACSRGVPCQENLRRLFQWATASVNRRKWDFTEDWRQKGTKKSWDVHRDHYLDTWKNAKKCVEIIAEQIKCGQCIPRPPELEMFPQWKRDVDGLDDPGPFRIPVPEPAIQPNYDNSNWDIFWKGAVVAGTWALVAGQAGPQVAAPEEVVTVPGAGLIGGFVAVWAASQ